MKNGINIIILVLSYLIGSIPFGLILSYSCGLGDIRKEGSGNIGATNVFRKSKKLAIVTLLLDSAKGFIAVALVKNYSSDQTLTFISALFSIIGHIFPIWLSFKGGKGVATLLGSMLLIEYKLFILFMIFWIVFFIMFKYSSLSSIISTVSTALLIRMYCTETDAVFFIIIALLIIIQHTDNIIRILRGDENKISIKF